MVIDKSLKHFVSQPQARDLFIPSEDRLVVIDKSLMFVSNIRSSPASLREHPSQPHTNPPPGGMPVIKQPKFSRKFRALAISLFVRTHAYIHSVYCPKPWPARM